jgi:hypothetical protein
MTLKIEPYFIALGQQQMEGDFEEFPEECDFSDPHKEGYSVFELQPDGTELHKHDIGLSDMDEYLEYLDWLRGEGPVNMFGATPYLVTEFELPEDEAEAILVFWMSTYSQRHPAGEKPEAENQDGIRLMLLAYQTAQLMNQEAKG